MDIRFHSFGKNTLAFELNKVLIKEHINLNAAEPEKLNDLGSQYNNLKYICFPDFNNNNDVALAIGMGNIDLISPKIIIKGNQNVHRAVLTALGWTIAGRNNDNSQAIKQQPPQHSHQLTTQ